MGRCVKIPGKPSGIKLQLPGGAKISSMSGATQQIPNVMDPFQSVLDGAQPALGAISPVFDVIDLLVKFIDIGVVYSQVIGSIMGIFLPGNPFTELFHLDPLKDENGNEVKFLGMGPSIPDFASVAPELLEKLAGLSISGLNVAGLIPQLSIIASIKDSVITAMGLADAVIAQVNGIADALSSIQPPDTGVPAFDEARQCSSDGATQQLMHKLGPASNLVPLMAALSKLAQVAAKPLPSAVYKVAKLAIDMGVIPFPDDDMKESFLGIIEDMTITGMPIEIPDFSDLSNLGAMLTEMKEKLEPVLEVLEVVQDVFDKLRQQ